MAEEKKQNELMKLPAQRFVEMVTKEFTAEIGESANFTEFEKTLAQHLFLKIDSILKDLEVKRLKDGKDDKAPYSWDNINMRKLALDGVHRIKLGLDALITNHIHPIPYFNGKEKKYDLDLRVGYVGKNYYRRQNALEQPVDIIYELVYANDVFEPIKKSKGNPVEEYIFEIPKPFDRGEAVGGFGYIVYSDPTKNKLTLLTKKDFEKSMNYAQSKDFWNKHADGMKLKTIVHRTTDNILIDPKKVNAASYAYVEQQDSDEGYSKEDFVRDEIRQNANKDTIDIKPTTVADSEPEAEPEKEPEKSGPDF